MCDIARRSQIVENRLISVSENGWSSGLSFTNEIRLAMFQSYVTE